MPGLVKFAFLVFIGLALAMGYNAWPIAADGTLPIVGRGGPATLDVMSYAGGLITGMLLWQVGTVPWLELPTRIHTYLAAQVQFYQFVLFGGACVAILFYF